jgi:ferritin-like metal-binding protein YciE
MATKIESLNDLLIEEMRDIYHAEKQLLKALPKMAKAAESPDLRDALTNHRKQTEGQVNRLESAFEKLGVAARGKKCLAMEGLIAEGEETIEEGLPAPLGDLAIIAAAQKVEHYEISGYGTLIALANNCGYADVAKLLKQTSEEESSADSTLTRVAESLMKSVAA